MLVEKMTGQQNVLSKIRLRDFATDECHLQRTLAQPQRCTVEKLQEGFGGRDNSLVPHTTKWVPVVFVYKKAF